ncbi:MAG TPA: hypothetical protein VD886_01765 [Herpetosiphonaceae bacterium]|nr:hypothetical protein [Herpetosiphonaceae bacterium]
MFVRHVRLLALALGGLLLAACAATSAPTVIPTPSKPAFFSNAAWTGVIVPAEQGDLFYRNLNGRSAPGYWTPSEAQVNQLEQALPNYLRDAAPERSADLWQKVAPYKRQYIGIVQDDQEMIYVNAMCSMDDDSWQTEPVMVMDGGDCFFNVTYDPLRGQFSDLSINGDA